MKAVNMVMAVWLCVPIAAAAADEIRFTISTEVARKINVPDSAKYVSEFGDATGPFAHVGSAIIGENGMPDLAVSGGASITSTRPHMEPNHTLQVEYFVNERGHGFAVMHKTIIDAAQETAVKEEDSRPSEHVDLAGAAARAVSSGKIKLLEALLEAGLLIDVPLELDSGWTALHMSAVQDRTEVAKMLLAKGASLDVRDKFGRRPIDYAFEDNAFELCEVLRKPERKERSIGSLPEPLLEELFSTSKRDEGIRFLSINGADPSDELLKYFSNFWPNVRQRSMAEEVPADIAAKDNARSCYRDVKTRDYGRIVELELNPVGDQTGYDWSHREATGPALSGGGRKGKVSKLYGYWLKHHVEAWDE